MRWVTANQLETWARGVGSTVELAKVVSDLIRASASDIAAMRFPSGDKGQVRGFDGHLLSGTDAMNVPMGRSYWEFGTNESYKSKATEDFDKRTGEVSEEEQRDTTFVLVTPWTWDSSDPKNKIEDWVKAAKARSHWKDVRYLDGVQLESWLDNNPAVAVWHARNTFKITPPDGIRSIDEFWREYSGQFDPAITEEVLLCERDKAAEQLIDALAGPPGTKSLVADSPDEVVAFAVAAIRKAKPEVSLFLEARTLVVDTMAAGRQLLSHENLVLILRDDAARSPSQFAAVGSVLVPLGRQNLGGSAERLNRPTGYALGTAMKSMGLGENEALTLARGCGRSLTALARLKPGGSLTAPPWLTQGSALLPAVLAGAWDAANEKDRATLETISGGRTYAQIEASLRPYLRDADPPFDLEGSVWKVRAPMDAFIQVGTRLGASEASALRTAMLDVFGELEPEADLDEPIDFSRKPPSGHSEWIREGLATTLLLLAVWSEQAEVNLATESGQDFANRLVKDLPGLETDYRLLESLRRELPLLAEAAPGPLLSALERMLEGNGDLIRPIFTEKAGLLFPTSKHAGLLWALETLAWDPDTFRRAVLILSKLASIDPGGKIGNRPFNSLTSIFLPWFPGTNAAPPQRLAALDEIASAHPKVGWNLIKTLLPSIYGSASPTAKPVLREAGASERPPITRRELAEMHRAIIQRALRWVGSDIDRWGDIVPAFGNFPPDQRRAATTALSGVLTALGDPEQRALWNTLREDVARHERFRSAKWAMPEAELAPLKAVVDRFAPADPITSIAFLFDTWALDETGSLELANRRRAEILGALRKDQGLDGVLRLARQSKLPHLVVEAIAGAGLAVPDLTTLLDASFVEEPEGAFTYGVATLFRLKAGSDAALRWLQDLERQGTASPAIIGRLLLGWPDEPSTWAVAKRFGKEAADTYWANKSPRYITGPRTWLLRSLVMLLRHGRSANALQSGLNRLDEIPTRLMLALLDGLLQELNAKATPADTMISFYVERALEALDRRDDVEPNQIAQREYAYLPLLRFSNRSLKIYDLMAADPAFYQSVIRDVFRGKNESQRDPDAAARVRAELSYTLLNGFDRLPGAVGAQVDAAVLLQWIDEVLRIGADTDRTEITQSFVGRTLAHAPVDQDGGWPHRAVRDEIERLASDDIERGIQIERYNMRGVHGRAVFEGGDQERDLAAQNYKSADLAAAWPRASALLRAIAKGWEQDARRADLEAAQRKLRS